MDNIISRFKVKYHNLFEFGLNVYPDLLVIEGDKFIAGDHPFIFDRRWLPKSFEDCYLRFGVNTKDLPPEFQLNYDDPLWYKHQYLWAPERFELFVDRCAKEIRTKLQNSEEMSRNEMLDALCFGDFEAHKARTEIAREKGELPDWSGL